MTTPRRGLLFHFTHITNLASIASSGLHADNAVQAGGQLSTEVGNQGIKAPRRSVTVPVGPGGVVADYVPFYFAARSPMLGSIHTGRVPTYTGSQREIVYLVTSVDRVVELQLPFVFTDRNAFYDYARYGTDIDELDNFIDWNLMEGRMWNNTDAEPDRMERRMAEFLVHQHVPWGAFLGVAAYDEDWCHRSDDALSSVGVTATVLARPEWYF